MNGRKKKSNGPIGSANVGGRLRLDLAIPPIPRENWPDVERQMRAAGRITDDAVVGEGDLHTDVPAEAQLPKEQIDDDLEQQFRAGFQLEAERMELERLPARTAEGHFRKSDRLKEISKELRCENDQDVATKPPPLKKRGSRGLAKQDAPLVEEIMQIVEAEGISDWSAATRVAERAAGNSTEAKVKRLVGRVQLKRGRSKAE